jgi:biopolymer transport protein ExbD
VRGPPVAEKRQFLDVWIVETNTVYREVPFTVVTDWVQQGRLLADDMLRPSGTKDWTRLAGMPPIAAYLPRNEPFRAEDQAEALESVHVDFTWQHKEDEDEDVDMIPLIDVSLVLLIFFMMTASAATMASTINTPTAEYAFNLVNEPGVVWIGIERVDGRPVYSIGKGEEPAQKDDQRLTEQDLLQRLDARLKEGRANVQIRADRLLPYSVVKRMHILLELRRDRGVGKISDVVSEERS